LEVVVERDHLGSAVMGGRAILARTLEELFVQI